jgi:hypothetical protein
MSTPPPIRRLAAIFDEIKAELPDDVVFRVGGPDEAARNDPSNRIVMEPSSRAYEGGHGIGRALLTRVEIVRMHIWGKTMDDVEELEELLINAIVKAVSWAIRPGTGAWRLKALSERGFLVTQEMAFLIPILRRELKAPLTEGPLVPVIESPI